MNIYIYICIKWVAPLVQRYLSSVASFVACAASNAKIMICHILRHSSRMDALDK